MKKSVLIVFILIYFLSLSACGMVSGKGDAEKVAESLFNERIQNGWDGTRKYYSELFWKKTDDQKWDNIQNIVTKTMGDLKSFSLQSWNVQNKVYTNELSGIVVKLVYETQYEKGKGVETLVIHKPTMGKKFLILGHNINSDLIQELIQKGIEQAISEEGE